MTTFLNKNKDYLLADKNNYKEELETDKNSILNKYITIVIEYLIYLFESNILTKNSKILEFVIIRGLDTITHVFLNLLCCTKNIELVFFHCEKSLYFYLEFVSQIAHEDRSFLQLTSRDACSYVYKKTIYDVPHDLKNKHCSEKTKETINIVSINIDVYKLILYKMINKMIKSPNNIKQTLNVFYELVTPLNALNLNEHDLKLIHIFINMLNYNTSDLDILILFLEKLLKKIGNQPTILHNLTVDKIHSINYTELNINTIDTLLTNIFRL